ncbi:MAG TPA: M6 family metalloprotease domain-containing protein, partial [Bacteroidales bacterium]|nr:M6 family metalloprotease domain-containing protein [Bacteroidales bacterium]
MKTIRTLAGLYILVAGMFFFPVDRALAVTANPAPIQYTQPDGSAITIQLKGDESIHWAETSDGYTILSDSKGFYEYATLDRTGRMTFSGIVARNPEARSAAERTWLEGTGKGLFFSRSQVEEMKRVLVRGGETDAPLMGGFPTTGTRKLLMILANFNNTTTTYPQTNFSNYMNQVNYNGTGSFRDFYLEVSYGQLTVNTTVTVWVTVPNTHDYYGPESKWGEFAYDAVVAAHNQASVNFAEFDNNLDGVVDGVAIIHQGQGQEETGNVTDIWSHSWELSSAGYSSSQTLFDGVQVDAYTTMPERNSTGMGTIGVMCHEFGHNLGAPDFYDTDYSTNGSYSGTGKWDVMANGSWNGNSGTKPAHPNAWIKAYFGWTSPTVLTSTQTRLLRNAQAYSDVVRYNTTTSNEYFLCENRQQTGFDVGIPGHGLIIYHVDGNYISLHSNANNINASSHQGLYPVCANASGNPPTVYGSINGTGCPFPGSGSKTTFTDATTPHAHSWAGANTGYPLTNITENTSTKEITFCFLGCGLPDNPTGFSAMASGSNQINLGWNLNSSSNPVMVAYSSTGIFGTPVTGSSYTAGNSISGGGTVLYNGASTSFVHSGLTGNTTYYYKAWSVASGTNYSSGVTANAATPCSITYPVSVTITVSANPACTGSTVTFTATPVNGGTNPAYQWMINGSAAPGSTNATFVYIPSNGDAITCTLVSSLACTTGNPAISNTINMSVNPPLRPGSISSSQTFCAGQSPSLLTGTSPLNGTSPVYQWQSSLDNNSFTNISGATSLNYQPGTLTTTTYYRQMQNASGTCAGPKSTNVLTLTVNPLAPVSVSISVSANPVCAGTTVICTASVTNGGSAPEYQWKINGDEANNGINDHFYFEPADGDVLTCEVVSTAACAVGNPAISNAVVFSILPELVTGTIGSNQVLCEGATPGVLTGTPPLNGNSPEYQWQSSLDNNTFANISGATLLNFQPGNLNATTYFRQMQNATGTCGGPLPTNTVTLLVNSQTPVSVTIAASANPVCAGTSVNFTATVMNGGTMPQYQWKVNGANAA